MRDVISVIVLRKPANVDGDKFVYPFKAAEFAIALEGKNISDNERGELTDIFAQLLQKVE